VIIQITSKYRDDETLTREKLEEKVMQEALKEVNDDI